MRREWKRPAALCLAAVMLFGLNGLPALAESAATPESAASPETALQAAPQAKPETPSFYYMPRIFALFSAPGEPGTAGDFQVGGGVEGTDYTYENGVLTLYSGSLTVAMEEGGPASSDRIVVKSGFTGTLTLDNVNIDQSGAGGCALALEAGANVNLILTGVNTLKSGGTEAGLYVPEEAVLTVTGDGDLTAQGGNPGSGGGAGIGGSGDALSFGTITLQGTGTITATGGNRAAGIGSGGRQGGDRVVDGTIRIESGTIMATSGQNAAAIGCGPDCGSDQIEIRITGGQVTAIDGRDGAGIGAGWSTNGVGTIEITGGTVYAKGTGQGAGLGKPGGSDVGRLVISGGMVTADSDSANDINCRLSTGSDGHAVICADFVNMDGWYTWSALVVSSTSSEWYGKNNHIICDSDLILTDRNLTIPEGCTLTADRIEMMGNGALTVAGTLDVQWLDAEDSALTVEGSLQAHKQFELWNCDFTNSGNTLLHCDAEIHMYSGGSFTNTGMVEEDGERFYLENSNGWPFANDGLFVSTDGGWFRADELKDYECRIFFDGNGGTPAASDLITENKVLTDLPDASLPGYTFDGWYTAPDGGDQVTSAYAFEVGTTVYAHWTETPATPTPAPTVSPAPTVTPAPSAAPASTPDPAQHTLRFVTNGGFPVDPVTIGRGAIVELWPYNPTRSGYLFAGWYADEALTQPVSSVLMNGDKTVYAAWKADPAAATSAPAGTTDKTGSTGSKSTATPAPTEVAAPQATVTPAPTQTAQPTVSPAPTQTPSPTPAVSAEPEDSVPAPAEQGGLPLWPFLAGGAVIVAALAFVLLRRRN